MGGRPRELRDPAHQWSEENVERLAEAVFNAMGPAFVTITSRLGEFEPVAQTYDKLPDTAKQMFRDALAGILRRRDEWRT